MDGVRRGKPHATAWEGGTSNEVKCQGSSQAHNELKDVSVNGHSMDFTPSDINIMDIQLNRGVATFSPTSYLCPRALFLQILIEWRLYTGMRGHTTEQNKRFIPTRADSHR